MAFNDALKRYWLLVVALGLVGAGVGFALGEVRTPVYTSESVLSVGRLDAPTQATPGFIEGAKNLASTYSRIAVSEPLLLQIARRTGRSPVDLQTELTAQPIPDEPVFRISATGSSPLAAVRLTRTATDAMIRYIRAQVEDPGDAAAMLDDYRTLISQVTDLNGRIARLAGNPNAQALVARLRVQANVTQLRASSIASQYSQTLQNTTGALGVRLLESGLDPINDRSQVTQRLAFIGLLAGLVLGGGVAGVLAARRPLRR